MSKQSRMRSSVSGRKCARRRHRRQDATLPHPDNTLSHVRGEFAALGAAIRRAEEWRGAVTFADVGAVIYVLRAAPWVVQDFAVESHLPALEALQARLDEGRPLQFAYTRFLIEAAKS
jgi:hypothetical protein